VAAIVLIGFMGSGKSTLGQKLATALGVDFVDLDQRLEAEQGCSIRHLLARHGEAGFRALELRALHDLLTSGGADRVIATGGGVVESQAARPLLRRLGRVVWLRANPEACVARLGTARGERPLLDDESSWRARYQRREPLYRDLAELVVETHPAALEASLEAVLHGLGLAPPGA